MQAKLDQPAFLILAVIALLILFFVTRPEVWARLFFAGIDPRPAALMRIGLGLTTLWTFISLTADARRFFTDEGIFLTSMARARFGGALDHAWDPVHGFEYWWSPLEALAALPTVLHLRSDPALAFTVHGLLLVSLLMMVLGAWTRSTTILSWILAEQLYRYNPLFYMGGDYVIRAFLFLGMLSRWGEAYSIDSWRRSRRVIASGGVEIPTPGPIPAWPFRIMMVQLACIYVTAGLTKTGVTWSEGTALYYALNLEHFYRVPAQWLVTWLQWSGLLPLLTWMSRWWEILFPLALVGAVLRGYEADRAAGVWPASPPVRRWLSYGALATLWLIVSHLAGLAARRYFDPGMLGLSLDERFLQGAVSATVALAPLLAVIVYRWLRVRSPQGFDALLHWVLGKRSWLVFGLLLHIGIDIGMNIGTFSQVMIATYLCWLSGAEVDAFWRYVFSSALRPGEGARPRRAGVGVALAPFDRLRYRGPCPAYTVNYHPDDVSVRRAALLRIWDVGNLLRFMANRTVPSGTIRLDNPSGPELLQGPSAGRAMIAIFPALWWLSPASWIPGLSRLTGACALRVLGLGVALPTATPPLPGSRNVTP